MITFFLTHPFTAWLQATFLHVQLAFENCLGSKIAVPRIPMITSCSDVYGDIQDTSTHASIRLRFEQRGFWIWKIVLISVEVVPWFANPFATPIDALVDTWPSKWEIYELMRITNLEKFLTDHSCNIHYSTHCNIRIISTFHFKFKIHSTIKFWFMIMFKFVWNDLIQQTIQNFFETSLQKLGPLVTITFWKFPFFEQNEDCTTQC